MEPEYINRHLHDLKNEHSAFPVSNKKDKKQIQQISMSLTATWRSAVVGLYQQISGNKKKGMKKFLKKSLKGAKKGMKSASTVAS